MPNESIYVNAPLVEVIAEVHWQLIPLATMPGAGVDPYYDATVDSLLSTLRQRGFRHLEKLIPTEVPREMVANQPTHRFRKEAGKSPLYQFGPGVFTANVIPPYEGWTKFVPILRGGIDALLRAYPLASETMKITHVHLRYVDAFTSRLGFADVPQFFKDGLGVEVKFPEKFASMHKAKPTSCVLNYEIESTKPAGAVLQLVAGSGKSNEEDGVVMQLSLTSPLRNSKPQIDDLMAWFDEAHAVLKETFESLTTDDLKRRMGPKKELA